VAPPPKSDSVDPLEYKVHDVLKLITDHAPANKNSPYAPYLPGFTSLRLLLIKPDRTAHENDLMTTMLDSYSSYLPTGRPPAELAWMIARDFMLLTQSPSQPSNAMGSSQAQVQPANNGTGGMIQHHGHQQQMPRHQQGVQQQLSGLSQHLMHSVVGMSAQHHMPPQQLNGSLQAQHPGGIQQQAGDQRHSAFHPLVQHHSSSQLAHHSGGHLGL
jgi:hypothetical protein